MHKYPRYTILLIPLYTTKKKKLVTTYQDIPNLPTYLLLNIYHNSRLISSFPVLHEWDYPREAQPLVAFCIYRCTIQALCLAQYTEQHMGSSDELFSAGARVSFATKLVCSQK